MHRSYVLVAVAFTILSPALARAAEPFSLTATGGGISVTATGDDVVDLAGNLIDAEAQFAPLAGDNITGSLRYGSLQDAVLFSRNAAGTSATLTIPSTGFQRTFTAANEDELEDEIRDFFEEEGAGEYAKFLAAINEQTSLGVADGNPLAATALLADLGFYRFGFAQGTRRPGDAAIPLPAGFDLRLAGGVSDLEDFDATGYYASIGLGASFRLGDRIALAWGNAFRYREVEGAAIYQYGTTIGLPIAIIPGGDEDGDGGFSWRLTPAFVGGFGGSWDLAAGGILLGGQLTSSASFYTDGWTFVLANQAGFYEGTPIDIGDFRFETDTSQVILKNGIQVIRDLGDAAFVDAGIAWTNLLEDAFIEDYLTPTAGIGFRLGGAVLRAGYFGNFSDDFTSHGGEFSLVFAF